MSIFAVKYMISIVGCFMIAGAVAILLQTNAVVGVSMGAGATFIGFIIGTIWSNADFDG